MSFPTAPIFQISFPASIRQIVPVLIPVSR
jgi:hypothetical protein